MSYAIDVTISPPSQANFLVRDGASPSDSASVRAALAKVEQKRAKYQRQCDAQGVSFVATAVCCFGGWLEDSTFIAIFLAERTAYRSVSPVAVIKSKFWQRLSVALWKGNASQILHYY